MILELSKRFSRNKSSSAVGGNSFNGYMASETTLASCWLVSYGFSGERFGNAISKLVVVVATSNKWTWYYTLKNSVLNCNLYKFIT